MMPQAFANPKLQRFNIAAKPRTSRDLLWGILLEFAALTIYVVSALLLLVFLLTSANSLMPYTLIVLAMPAATRMRRKAKRYRLDSQGKLLRDHRDPILYLRPFNDDNAENADRVDKRTYEELLTSVLDDAGPVVAAGRPGEVLPLLGATRLYFKGMEWRASVQYLMSISQFIAIQADISEGLEWELDVAAKNLSHERLLISFLSWRAYDKETRQSLYDRFRKHVEKIINCSMPDELNESDFLYFESNWEGRMVEVSRWKRLLFKLMEVGKFRNSGLSVTRIRESLRPLLKKRGVKLGVGRTLFDLLMLFVFITFSVWLVYYNYVNGINQSAFAVLFALIINLVANIWSGRKRKSNKPNGDTITLNLR